MTEIIQNGRLSIPLYHGTSTLFVDSIANHGLGGMNPVKEWSLLELAKEVLLLSEGEILPRSSESLYGDLYALSNPAYEMKTQQSNLSYRSGTILMCKAIVSSGLKCYQ